MTEFKPGDVVRLKRPPMTVERVGDVSGLVELVWFEGAELYRSSVKPELLEIAPEASS